ncbi:MAG: Nif3-like dinuclear metal center hexameric protein [Campylobacteraceae bacterium]|jgi:dinuclear metal center YbgI/SA1388 family protein|nr:Nif3-like dinuclear metal center hexameric protein [Campylobacteraceae bacterium]
MKIEKIYGFLDALSPFELQEEWDNSGLLTGSLDDEVEQVCISLDIDSDMADKALPKTLFITHHPLIFKGLKRLDFSRYPSNILKTLIQKNCALIAMHTNIDKTHLNRYVAENILGFKIEKSEGFVCYFETDKSFDELASHIKKRLALDNLKVSKAHERIKRVAFCTGSGGDLIEKIEADCFISGDFKYHQALCANENKISLIDIGHFESERYFSQMLGEHLKNFPLKVIITNCKNPFEYK